MPIVSHGIFQLLFPHLSTSSVLRDTDPYDFPGPLVSGREMGEKKEIRVSVHIPLVHSQQGQQGLVYPLAMSQLLLALLFPVPTTTPPHHSPASFYSMGVGIVIDLILSFDVSLHHTQL